MSDPIPAEYLEDGVPGLGELLPDGSYWNGSSSLGVGYECCTWDHGDGRSIVSDFKPEGEGWVRTKGTVVEVKKFGKRLYARWRIEILSA